MIFLKWALLCIIDWALLIFTALPAAIIVPIFTKARPYKDDGSYSWGAWWGTYDNPPQGDEGFVAERAPFPNVITGWKGYINRVTWMLRNPLYGFAKRCALPWDRVMVVEYKGDPDISDKEGRPGWYLATVRDDGLKGFEFYGVFPWSSGRCLRIRIGWKILTDKFQRYGFAQFVNTINPFDGYGK